MITSSKEEFFPKSVISVTEKLLVREIIEEHNYFEEEYPVWEDSEDSEDDDDSVDSRDGVDERAPPPWKRTKDLRSKMHGAQNVTILYNYIHTATKK